MRTLEIFEPKQHYLTTVYRNRNRNARRVRIKSVDQLERLVENQPKDSDLYITKYGKDGVVWNIILDFDSEDDKELAWNDCLTISKFLERKGIDCVIVDSTNKGYHCYVQIPPTNFKVFFDEPIEEPSLFFKYYVIELLNLDSFKLISLDEVNFNASLDGNIRVISSIHPKTNQMVYIKQGKFHDINENLDYYENAMHYHDKIIRVAFNHYKEALEEIETKRLQYANRLKTEDDLLSMDLRDVFQNIFSLQKVRKYGNTIWCCCPFHETATSNPSFCITPTHYFCASCGEKGNIFTLIKKGLVEQPKQEYWITQGAKQWLH
jgi:hypothetical protein